MKADGGAVGGSPVPSLPAAFARGHKHRLARVLRGRRDQLPAWRAERGFGVPVSVRVRFAAETVLCPHLDSGSATAGPAGRACGFPGRGTKMCLER